MRELPVLSLITNLNTQLTKQREAGHSDRQDISGNGTTGLNAGAWRLRADWQGRYSRTNHESDQRWDWNRFYAYRAIAPLRAKLTLGGKLSHLRHV
ncbi:Outer membrane usher protein papC precursor [Morganella morganii]|nr:Outer membrane usher protein papC precursor [Morganella morganii]